ncbi:hypothetical protein [Streptomyces nigrescens]|uniref:Uncharacterized protein n=1 Tax=Streptomyces nigrescens TaxID=1920 RepID=A0A640TBE5_STRNI|nr:hypothetical protein Sliba_02540 [Streptomyces libani subsp. libani]GGV84862.1 hypothetical protein GCM10010500_00090 [Streptomyces libani subsp. libani]
MRWRREGACREGACRGHTEAISLLALSAGLGTSVLVGQRTPEAAAPALRHHLDRLFPNSG